MTARWGLIGDVSQDWLSYYGRILWHDNPHELEYLVPIGARAMQIPDDIGDEYLVPLRDHHQMWHVVWPLTRDQFNRP